MPEKEFLNELNDSKKLTEKKREKLYKKLIEMSISSPPARGELEGGIIPKVFF